MPTQDREVPLVDVTRQMTEIKDEAIEALDRVLSSGRYILGPEVDAFEKEMAAYIGVEHAVGVGSGTDALFLILKALELGPGDEVVTTPFTFIASADVISLCGARPVFADIDPATYNIDPQHVKAAISESTKAIIAVHLFGQPSDLDELADIAHTHDLYLIEDCAQSLGARYAGRIAGSFGVASAFSFFPSKNLGGAGDGGMVCTGDGELARRIRALRAHGSTRKYEHESIGVNSRLDELQAAVLRLKMKHLDEWNRMRAEIASRYDELLTRVQTPTVGGNRTHVYHQYTVRAAERDSLASLLSSRGIGSAVYYHRPLHLQTCFDYLGHGAGDMPQSEKAASEVLSLPIFPGMTPDELETVCRVIQESAW